MLPLIADREVMRENRESSDVREGNVSTWLTGERAEMSYAQLIYLPAIDWMEPSQVLTNDRRYESNDSREMEKGSFSFTRLRWFEDPAEPGYLRQKLCFSGGDGYQSIVSCKSHQAR